MGPLSLWHTSPFCRTLFLPETTFLSVTHTHVVGRSGVSDLKGIVVGSVAHKLISGVNSIPIGVVGGTPESQKVLVSFDGSEESIRGVDFVCSMLPGRDRDIMLCSWSGPCGFMQGRLALQPRARERLAPFHQQTDRAFLSLSGGSPDRCRLPSKPCLRQDPGKRPEPG